MKKLKFLGLVLLSALVLFMTACGEDAVQIGSEPTFIVQQTQPSTAPATSSPVATDSSEPTQPTEPVHIHAWCEATCTSAKTCTDCGTTEGEALGHKWQEATCTAPKTCTACGETEGDALGHNWQAATCAAPETCTVCGETAGEMLAHSWDAGVVTKEATETEEGEMLYTCTVCGETMTQSIPALNHEHSYTSVVTEPTCTSEGYTTHACHCGDSYITDETAALGHAYGAWRTVTEATCTEDGEERRTCARCDAFEMGTVAALGHDHTETVTAPTCTEQGYTTHTCHCGDSYITDETAARGHDFDDWQMVTEPTCVETGEEMRNCTRCDAYETRTVEAAGHNHTETVTAPTCTEQGYTTHTCHCGDSYITDETAALGHAYGGWQTVTEATCTEEGEEQRNCTRCDTFEMRAVAALGHDHVETVTAPTCTEQGYTTHTCHCGDSYITDETAALGHAYGGWQTVTEATCTEEGKEQRNCTRCDAFEMRAVAAKGHSEEIVKGYPATCTDTGLSEGSHCGVCKVVLVKQEVIPMVAHQLVEIPGKQPSEAAAGLTIGKQCADCGTMVQKQVDIPAYAADYSGDYYYRQMGLKSNGAALQKLYNRLDMAVMTFHFDTGLDAEALNQNGKIYYMACAVPFDDLGISKEDAVQIWLAYKNDHPLYYWIGSNILYTDTALQVLTVADYQYGADREAVSAQVLSGIKGYLALAEGETSNYYTAWAFHDAIIQAIDYARAPETNSPEDDLWAHSILGVIDGRGVVCEGYSRMFQLLLNAANVENIYVEGSAGSGQYGYEAHAWNMVKLDDGAWYWCDLTWDDRPTWYLGILYNHFCVNDSQDINWLDGGCVTDIIYFPDNHLAGVSADNSLICQVELPNISDHVFSSDDSLTVRTVFTVGDFTYSINGFYTVQLVSASEDAPQVLHIPETVEYEGVTYTVTAIGGLQADGRYSNIHRVISEKTKEISLPKTVRFIWDFCMRVSQLERICVDSENPWFTDVNGVLYTKSLYTLIQYPANAPFVEKYEIPEETHEIAYGALRDAGSCFSELVLGKNVEGLGRANWGSGYPDAYVYSFFGGNYVSGEFASLMSDNASTPNSLRISISPENSNFVVINDLLYSCENGTITDLLGSAYSEITEAIIADGVTRVCYGAFSGCRKLMHVVIPDSVTRIESWAFSGCASLTSIVIPESVTYIGEVAFYDCVSLTSIVIPDGVTSIGASAFLNCHSLTNVVIPETVTSIGGSAFSGCYALEDIVFAGTKEQWEAMEKEQCWNNHVPATEVVCVDGAVGLDG